MISSTTFPLLPDVISIRHEPGDAGTAKCFQDAKSFLDGFNLPFDVVTGNHGEMGSSVRLFPLSAWHLIVKLASHITNVQI